MQSTPITVDSIPLATRLQLQQAEAELSGWVDPVARLRQAIEKNEFELYCQPIIALSGPDAGGYPMAEILVRMLEEERTMLPPGDFLPVLEHYKMMPLLDRWVVRNTIKRLASNSPFASFTVNLSGQTLADAEFPRFVAAQLTSNKVPPAALAFEIDENDTLDHPASATRFAAAYRALGGKLLIDAFGRRSGSFAAIRKLGVAFVKVDGSIVRALATSELARTKLNAIRIAGNALGFALVGECVEDQDVLARLKSLGVRYAQGFGIAVPQPVTSYHSRLHPVTSN
jgi:EAL domain-containing protein (putative c-di-GMP-specific phosphodiesterase class I)